jgi:hypothetical protein
MEFFGACCWPVWERAGYRIRFAFTSTLVRRWDDEMISELSSALAPTSNYSHKHSVSLRPSANSRDAECTLVGLASHPPCMLRNACTSSAAPSSFPARSRRSCSEYYRSFPVFAGSNS